MPEIIQNTVSGAIKLLGIPERQCFSSWQDFVVALPGMLLVEVPASISGVIVSATEPSEDNRDRLWVRRDLSGNFLGLYAFQEGTWRPFYNLVPGEVVWLIGDSQNPPDGFTVITPGVPGIPTAVSNVLVGQYVPKPIPAEGYQYFAAFFTGFSV